MRAPHLVGVRALATWVCAPRGRVRPLLAGVRAPLDVRAPHLAGVLALRAQACVPLAVVRAPLDVRAPYLVGVRAPHQPCAPPSS
jgi:hypothetical protein